MTPPRSDAAEPDRDAWLGAALRHAPDAGFEAPEAVSAAILREARAAVAPAPVMPTRSPPAPVARRDVNPTWVAALWAWLARPSVGAGFATLAVATLVGLLWRDRPIDPLPAEPAVAWQPATSPAPAAASAAPGPSQPVVDEAARQLRQAQDERLTASRQARSVRESQSSPPARDEAAVTAIPNAPAALPATPPATAGRSAGRIDMDSASRAALPSTRPEAGASRAALEPSDALAPVAPTEPGPPATLTAPPPASPSAPPSWADAGTRPRLQLEADPRPAQGTPPRPLSESDTASLARDPGRNNTDAAGSPARLAELARLSAERSAVSGAAVDAARARAEAVSKATRSADNAAPATATATAPGATPPDPGALRVDRAAVAQATTLASRLRTLHEGIAAEPARWTWQLDAQAPRPVDAAWLAWLMEAAAAVGPGVPAGAPAAVARAIVLARDGAASVRLTLHATPPSLTWGSLGAGAAPAQTARLDAAAHAALADALTRLADAPR